MTLEQLRIFLAVAEQQHITRAAQSLHLTQSAVSAAVAALESRHGVRLFDRVGRAILLNDTGRAFQAEARAVLDSARAAENALDDLSALRRGRLSIMASQTVANHWLPGRLVAFRRAYPQVEIELGFANTDQVADGVESGRAELGLVEGDVNRDPLSRDLLDHDEMVVVVAPGHPWAGRNIAPDDLGTTPWVVRETGSGTRAAFDGLLQRAGVTPEIAMALPGNEAVIGVVEAGLGATLVSRNVARAHLAAGLLCLVHTPPVRRDFYLLRHRQRHRTQAAAAFLALQDG
ncbi:LysR family transcriptional regulator [Devosia aquimaris]|uniref:LysR family transcriptional regulator n=1 Tax=Devosia aquimaris TaxID=2866214 RepID=UPI001CD17F6F|nr:LysR family transcriptional regulator [Devosia sp. CJK-A8-3]